MMDFSSFNDGYFQTAGQTFHFPKTGETCSIVLKDFKSPTSILAHADRNIAAQVITDKQGKVFIAGEFQHEMNSPYHTGLIFRVVNPATVSRFIDGVRDGNGRQVQNTPTVIIENLPVHFKIHTGGTIETTPDRFADDTKRLALTLSSYALMVADLITVCGDTFKVLEVRHTNYGIDELFLQRMQL